MIRAFTEADVEKVKLIHEKHFEEEFDYPEFLKGFICAFVITDEDTNDIIAAGGVRTLAECVLITNKDFSARARRKALFEVLNAATYFAQKSGHDSLHAFIQNPEWLHQLKRAGFLECKGKALYIPVL